MAPKDTAYYDLLGVSPTATDAQIRKAYRLKALHCHPDRAGNSDEATAAFQHLKAVYEVLSDPDRREAYDEDGPPRNLHGDDDDGLEFDTDALASFFKRNVNPVTAEDILAYEKRYRNGPDELEDLTSYFSRFEGDVKRVVDYIPYSNDTDIERFVAIWDGEIEKGNLEKTEKWKRARKSLLKSAKKVKARNLDEEEEEEEEEEEDDEVEEEDLGDVDDGEEIEKVEKTKKKQSKTSDEGDTSNSKSKKKSKGKKANKAGDDLAALVASIQGRRQKGRDAFDAWAGKYEQMAKEEEGKKAARKANRRKSQGSPSELKVEGGVKKKKKAKS